MFRFRESRTAAAVASMAAAAGSGMLSQSQPALTEVNAQAFTMNLGDLFGGGGGMMMQQEEAPELQWPSGTSDKVDEKEYGWLINTEWQGKSGTFTFQRGGELGSSIKECSGQREGVCKWSANKGVVNINTPKTQRTSEKVLKFVVKGPTAYENGVSKQKDRSDAQKESKRLLDGHSGKELKKAYLESLTVAARTGKHSVLDFVKVAASSEEDSTLAKDAYAVLGLDQKKEPSQSDIKKAYRKLSIVNHPDKIKSDDPEKEKKAQLFEHIRMAYEILSNEEYRGYYDVGGALLVKNVETMYKEMEGQTAQMMAQLDQQVPKNHPMRSQAEAQIKAQQKDKNQMKHEIQQKMKNEDTEVEVEVELDDLFQGAENKEFTYSRLEICKGCRACNDADISDEELKSETCVKCANECGKCPPEIRQIPKMHGPFMVGSKEQEVESREKCATRKLKAKVRLPASASDGQFLKKIRNKGHETPGRIPGDVKLVVKRKPHAKFSILEESVNGGKNDLFSVLTISLEESLKGFVKSFSLFGKEKIVVDRAGKVTEPGQVIKLSNKGMHLNQVRRSDLYLRVKVVYPEKALDEGATSMKLEGADKGGSAEADLSAEDETNVKDGKLFRRWDLKKAAQEGASSKKKKGKKGKEEL